MQDICNAQDCDLHTTFCDHVDENGNQHNIRCFTHDICFFDSSISEIHQIDEIVEDEDMLREFLSNDNVDYIITLLIQRKEEIMKEEA